MYALAKAFAMIITVIFTATASEAKEQSWTDWAYDSAVSAYEYAEEIDYEAASCGAIGGFISSVGGTIIASAGATGAILIGVPAAPALAGAVVFNYAFLGIGVYTTINYCTD